MNIVPLAAVLCILRGDSAGVEITCAWKGTWRANSCLILFNWSLRAICSLQANWSEQLVRGKKHRACLFFARSQMSDLIPKSKHVFKCSNL